MVPERDQNAVEMSMHNISQTSPSSRIWLKLLWLKLLTPGAASHLFFLPPPARRALPYSPLSEGMQPCSSDGSDARSRAVLLRREEARTLAILGLASDGSAKGRLATAGSEEEVECLSPRRVLRARSPLPPPPADAG